MDNTVKRLVINVTLTLLVVLISIPLWSYSSEKNGIVDSYYKDLDIKVHIGDFDSLMMIENDRALAYINPTEISFRNQNNHEKDFSIILVITKSSTIDYRYLNMAIDNEIKSLKDLDMQEDSENYYFKLKEENLLPYSEKTMNFRIWLNEDYSLQLDNQLLITNIITRS